MRLIDADSLKDKLVSLNDYKKVCEIIDNAPAVDSINTAINIIKDCCNTNIGCIDCPMNPNCNEFPHRWEEV